jgi:hypothetical protein
MAADLSSAVFGFAGQKTSFDLDADYVVENYNIVFGVSVVALVGLFLCSAIMGALRGDPHIITRSLIATGTAVVGSFVALGLLQMILDASDGLSEAFAGGLTLGDDLVQMLQKLPERGNFALSMVMSLLVAMFSFALFIVLFVRKIAVIAIAVFIPLYLAGQGSATSQNWMRRAAEMLAALIFVKPVIYAIFTLGAGIAVDAGGSAADQTLALLTAIALMIASVLSPFALFRIIGFADTHLIKSVGEAGKRRAASFGHGAGAMLGATSRETFRGIGSRLQNRGRASLGGGGVGVGAGAGVGAAAGTGSGFGVGVGRPSARPGRPGSPVRTPAKADAPAAGVGSSARAGAPHARVGARGGSSAAAAAAGGGAADRGAPPRVRVRTGGGGAGAPAASAAAPGSAATRAARPNPPPARPARTAAAMPPARPGGGK